MGKRLYVGNLSYGVSSSDLEELFAQFGEVQSAQVVQDRDTGRSKGFGFVEMGSDEAAQSAITALNDQEHSGRRLTVNEARPREDREASAAAADAAATRRTRRRQGASRPLPPLQTAILDSYSTRRATRQAEVAMDIGSSVEAVLKSKDRIIERFYQRFLTEHPELKRHFEGIDLQVQAAMVTMSLVAVEGYYQHKFPATEHYLKVLGHRHYHTGVAAADLSKFSDALLRTLAEFHGPDWDDQLAGQWREALLIATRFMQEGYESSYTY